MNFQRTPWNSKNENYPQPTKIPGKKFCAATNENSRNRKSQHSNPASGSIFRGFKASYRVLTCKTHSQAPLHRVSKAVFNFKCREQSPKVVHDIMLAIKRQNSSEQLLKANIFVLFRFTGTFSIQMSSCLEHDKKHIFCSIMS